MRRKDRLVTDKKEIIEIIDQCQICRLAFSDENYPYILPLNFGYEYVGEKLILYFHSALEGEKVALINKEKKASFEMDCGHQLQYFADRGYCTYSYKSVIGYGNIEIIEDENMKKRALQILMDHYHKGKNAYFNPKAIGRTLVYCLKVKKLSAKKK